MNISRDLTIEDMQDAARRLARSTHGRNALRSVLKWLDDGGLSLDQGNQLAILDLLLGAWGPFAGSSRDAMREALEPFRKEKATR